MKIRSNRVDDIRKYYTQLLCRLYEEQEANAMLFILLEEYAGLTKGRIIAEPGLTLSESELLKVHAAVKELLDEKPLQYILKKTDFFGLTLQVSPAVLIPRPETEELVEWITLENEGKKDFSIIDIGTGSGCIAIALKKAFPGSYVTGIDIDNNALEIARLNSSLNQVDIHFVECDLLDERYCRNLGIFNLIVSNPPYVRESEKARMKKNVLMYEPSSALFVKDDDPLLFYRAIARFAKAHLAEKGLIYCEINQYLHNETADVFCAEGFINVDVRKDLLENFRFIRIST